MALYGALILLGVALVVCMLTNFPAGMVISTISLLFFTVLVLALALALAAGLVILHDGCGNIENLAVYKVRSIH